LYSTQVPSIKEVALARPNDVGVWTPSAGEVEDVGDTFVAVGSVGSSEVSSAFGWRRRESTGGDG